MKAFTSFIINFTSFIISGVIVCMTSIYGVRYVDHYIDQKEMDASNMGLFCDVMTGSPTYGAECKEIEKNGYAR